MKTSRENPFGILAFLHWNHEWNNWHFTEELQKKAVDQLSELGVGFVRMDILWSDVHAGYTKYNFDRYEKIISLLNEKKIQIVALLHYNKLHSDASGEIWNKPPDSIEEFSHYVGSTVEHFKERISHWEIWNEPNHPAYWAAPSDGLKTYSQLLKQSYKAAKSSDPSCIILNGGLARPIPSDLENLYLNECRNFFDILSIHPFINPLHENSFSEFEKIMTRVNTIMKNHNDVGKKIWITEMGCPGIPNEKLPLKWFEGEGPTESQQADWIEKQFSILKSYPEIEKIFWAFYRDTGTLFKDGTDFLGLVRFDFSPKPSFRKLKEIIARSK